MADSGLGLERQVAAPLFREILTQARGLLHI